MKVRYVDPEVAVATLEQALEKVEAAEPGMTASTGLTRGQKRFFIGLLVVVVVSLVVVPKVAGATLMTLLTLLYVATIWHRLRLVRRSLRADPAVHVSDEDARAVPDHLLPVYTVLVPAYGEPEVLGGLIGSLSRLEYPAHLLDVKLLLEEDDEVTIARAIEIQTDLPVEVLLVPAGEPRTKPRALDYGLQFARGELVTIYDAEDHPEPLQLRRAVVAFRRSAPEVACLQARLSFYGGSTNLLSKWFTAEYTTWFNLYLPGLVDSGAPVPLGGTSNHFSASALREVGGWDPWNVTEDCDLGLRLQRRGYTVGLVDSVTMEEPNTDIVNWVKQRSRWYKGYLQTFLVAMRKPRAVVRDLGWSGFAELVLFVGCTPLLAVLNLWFWSLSLVWVTLHAAFVQSLYPGAAYHLALAVWAFGNLAVIYVSLVTVRVARRPDLLVACLLSPLYWVLMSIAAVRAAIQLVTDPSHWEKTAHGLGGGGEEYDDGPVADSSNAHA
jgi:cellulose synthase/poly-beta-1,6-N-acetylglucosamine synthase-like glycosyltransferase